MSSTLISLRNCYKIYRDPSSLVETVALQGVDLDIQHGEILTIVGPSGSGKSTLLNIIGGLDTPSAGKVIHQVDSEEINLSGLTTLQRDQYRSKFVGYLQQKPVLMPQYTSLENVELPLQTRGVFRPRALAKSWLTRLGLDDRLESKPSQLSGGEKQRVSLASALVFNPRILLADEPTAEVDSTTAQQIITLLKELNEEYSITIVIVTHDKRVAQQGKRSLRLEDGKIIETKLIDLNCKFDVTCDQYSRITLPPDILEFLQQPSLVYVEPRNSEQYLLWNGEALDDDDFNPQSMISVDKEGRIKLPQKIDMIRITIEGNQVLLTEVNMEVER
ncbi:MAG: ABC transporter ATP-binding protein [Candidatus Kariarchaeaceae archaeon]|jgi:ABC-type lipoprotein export system ATPase subunit